MPLRQACSCGVRYRELDGPCPYIIAWPPTRLTTYERSKLKIPLVIKLADHLISQLIS